MMLTHATVKKHGLVSRLRHGSMTGVWRPQHPQVRHILRSVSAQPKLTVGAPNDKYEQEADRVADQVMRMRNSFEEEELLQPKRISPNDGSMLGPETQARIAAVRLGGAPLPANTRNFFEPRFGHDFSRVRVHTDAAAADSASLVNARAYTLGRDIVFGSGQFAPNTMHGRRLLAHELTHVVQQGAPPQQQFGREVPVVSTAVQGQIQGGFFGDLWEGITSIGSAIGSAVSGVAEWIGERFRDVALWVANLIRDLPARLVRFGQTIVEGLVGIVTFIPEAIQALLAGGISGFARWFWERAKRGGLWVLTMVSRIFDLLGGPELLQFVWHLMTNASPLTDQEKDAAKSVLGTDAIRWEDVRVSEGGLLRAIFALNNGRAFATFHTINLPATGTHGRSNLAIVVHELTHVYQFERTGSLYLGQAIHAQATIGYGYGGAAGLSRDRATGKHYRDYNREQQAQIAQDYYNLLQAGGSTINYDPFIAELQAGDL